MKILFYTFMLHQYGITYLDSVKNSEGKKIIYGYNKATRQYSFWTVVDGIKVKLIEVCESRAKAVFSYSILQKGV